MKQIACLVLFLTVPGCGFLFHDLVSQGVYRLESDEVGGCRLTATAVERGEGLLVEGRLTGAYFASPVTAAVEVSIVSPTGSVIETKHAGLRTSRNRRSSRAHAYLTAEFDTVPPAGTVIRVRQLSPSTQIPGCAKRPGVAARPNERSRARRPPTPSERGLPDIAKTLRRAAVRVSQLVPRDEGRVREQCQAVGPVRAESQVGVLVSRAVVTVALNRRVRRKVLLAVLMIRLGGDARRLPVLVFKSNVGEHAGSIRAEGPRLVTIGPRKEAGVTVSVRGRRPEQD